MSATEVAMPDNVDVVIVGAGFAGLTAAERLVSMGRSVLVLEGRDRVGGRSLSGEVAGVSVDLGATWVAKRHTAIHALAKRMGCTTIPQYREGGNVIWLAGKRHIYKGTIPIMSIMGLIDMARTQSALNKLVDSIDVAAPWNSPKADELDSITFEEWLDKRNVHRNTRALMVIVAKVQWGCLPGDVSMLHVLKTIKAAGGLDHMLDVENGQQEERIVETTQEIAKRLAASLGDRVRLQTPAVAIAQEASGVTVSTTRGDVKAGYVIVAVPPAMRAEIEFTPPLPEKAAGVARTTPMGVLSKAFVAYEKPFWRSNKLSGEALTDTGAAFITFDVTKSTAGPGVLMVFCDPRCFDGFAPEDRKRMVLEKVVDLFGPEAAKPIDYVDHCWALEDFSPGGPNPAVGPFATTTYGRVAGEPHGRVHWAGTEIAGEWSGSMNGAVLSGERTAEAVNGLFQK